MLIDTSNVLSNEQKTYALQLFIRENPEFELQDLYKWLYYGEFGAETHNTSIMKLQRSEELNRILYEKKLAEIQTNLKNLSLWKPMGLSVRFVMVNVIPYFFKDCPIMKLVDFLERSPAYRGTRVHFKLDWGFVKEYIIRNSPTFNKQDFYNFEDKVSFHQLPVLSFTANFTKNYLSAYRIVPRKLFFDYFPEFDTKYDIKSTRRGDSLIDDGVGVGFDF